VGRARAARAPSATTRACSPRRPRSRTCSPPATETHRCARGGCGRKEGGRERGRGSRLARRRTANEENKENLAAAKFDFEFIACASPVYRPISSWHPRARRQAPPPRSRPLPPKQSCLALTHLARAPGILVLSSCTHAPFALPEATASPGYSRKRGAAGFAGLSDYEGASLAPGSCFLRD
jgi:hypothetical protein